jgi:hypothetical protein
MAISAGCNRKVVPESCSSCANRRFGRTLACPCFKAGEHREKSRYQRQRAGKHRNARCSKPANLLNVASKRWNRVHSSTSTGPRPPIWRSHGVWRVIPIFLLNRPHSACDLRRGSAWVTLQTRGLSTEVAQAELLRIATDILATCLGSTRPLDSRALSLSTTAPCCARFMTCAS